MQSVFSEFKKLFGNQFFVFFAMYGGIKKAMDFWVPDFAYDQFVDMCKRYNILHLTDVKFVSIKDANGLKEKVIGGEFLTSTKFLGERPNSSSKGEIHVVMSMKQEYLDEIFKSSWYTIISNNRVIHKSMQDIQDFGAALGYPECCRKFFSEKNNWKEYSFLYEVYKKSESFDYRCNCFWKDNPTGEDLSYIYHMPCSFSCAQSIEYANKIEQKCREFGEENILEKTQHYLKLPCIIIREQKIYAFEGTVNKEDNTITYEKNFFLGSGKEKPTILDESINKGNLIHVLDERFIDVYSKNNDTLKHLYRYDCQHQSEIEIPFIIQFT